MLQICLFNNDKNGKVAEVFNFDWIPLLYNLIAVKSEDMELKLNREVGDRVVIEYLGDQNIMTRYEISKITKINNESFFAMFNSFNKEIEFAQSTGLSVNNEDHYRTWFGSDANIEFIKLQIIKDNFSATWEQKQEQYLRSRNN